jgi:hypothetical protein
VSRRFLKVLAKSENSTRICRTEFLPKPYKVVVPCRRSNIQQGEQHLEILEILSKTSKAYTDTLDFGVFTCKTKIKVDFGTHISRANV